MARYVGDWLKRADKAVWKRLAHWGDGRWTLILTALMLLLMVRQTVVIEKQDEILGRRAKLTAVITEERRDTEGVSFLVSVENGGRKAAQSFYYTLLIPTNVPLVSVNSRRDTMPPLAVIRDYDIGGISYHHYRDFFPLPAYPNIPVDVAAFKIRNPAPGTSAAIPILWRVSTEDGVFPDPDVLGRLTITLSMPAPTPPKTNP